MGLDLISSSLFFKSPRLLRPYFGPTLNRFHGDSQNHVQPFTYQPSTLEQIASTALSYNKGIFSVAQYYLLYRSFLYTFKFSDSLLPCAFETGITIAKCWLGIGLMAWFCVGAARRCNECYMDFLETLFNRKRAEVSKYDFDMKYWPIDYRYPGDQNVNIELQPVPSKSFNPIFDFLCNGIGRWLIMPGSLGIINKQVGWQLNNFRHKYIENYKNDAKRLKFQIADNAFIDALYIRPSTNSNNNNSDKIIICSEGNAGFYEVGIMASPLRQGYSVLGWNRPGFGQSSGDCTIENERLAIITILEYVRNELKYPDDKIITYGWSIGGYPSAVAGNAIDKKTGKKIINQIVLDATFDHITPLAGSVLPNFLLPLGKKLINHGWNLDVDKEVQSYEGKILFYRRLRDEIISPGGPMRPDLNRANFLVMNYLVKKFDLKSEKDSEMEFVREYLLSGGKLSLESKRKVQRLQGKEAEIWTLFQNIFVDLNQGHNEPMPHDKFRLPY